MSADSNEARRRAEELFKKEQQWREGQPVMAEYQAELRATREKTARLRALRLARDAANKKQASPANLGAARLDELEDRELSGRDEGGSQAKCGRQEVAAN